MPTIAVNIKFEPWDVLATRPGKFGNKFRIGKDGTRKEVVAKHREWLKTPEGSIVMMNLHELRGKRIGCVCKPLACHVDNLVIACDSPGDL